MSRSSIIPPPESFPPPATSSSQSPSSQSSGRKRKRDVSVAGSTRFTEATRSQLLSQYGSECWLCNANTRLDNCHVIGQKDRGAGRSPTLRISCRYPDAITLCPTCHREYDDTQCPGFIFFPSNLQFFINFERQDFERRCRWTRDGCESPARICPSAEQYQTESSDLYERIILQNYLPRLGNETSDIIGALQSKSWHGSPMVALMRTFLILRSPVLGGAITREQRALLRELQDLYLRPDPAPQLADSSRMISPGKTTLITASTSESGRASTQAQNTQLNARDPLSLRGQESHEPGGPDSAVDVETTGYRSDREGRAFKRMRHGSDDTENRWSWGPASSSQDKASWLPRMMGHTDVE